MYNYDLVPVGIGLADALYISCTALVIGSLYLLYNRWISELASVTLSLAT